MTSERRKRLILHSVILCGMIVCMFFSFQHHYRHHFAFGQVFWGLLLINSALLYKYNLNRRQPDTLIHLFPTPPEAQGKI
jgi:hypothetical protein